MHHHQIERNARKPHSSSHQKHKNKCSLLIIARQTVARHPFSSAFLILVSISPTSSSLRWRHVTHSTPQASPSHSPTREGQGQARPSLAPLEDKTRTSDACSVRTQVAPHQQLTSLLPSLGAGGVGRPCCTCGKHTSPAWRCRPSRRRRGSRQGISSSSH
jgi:hypothetical protein